jgi:hypothetical protein
VLFALPRNEFRNRAFAFFGFERDIAEAWRAFALRPAIELVEEAARLAGGFRHVDGADATALGDQGLERVEGHVFTAEDLRDVLNHQWVAHIRLVGAVFQDRVFVGHVRQPFNTVRRAGPVREFLENAIDHRSHRAEDVFLLHETHFHVELVEFSQAVGAAIFIAEARRNLKVTVETAHHQQLLELLRRLWQRIELAGVQA